MYQTKREFFLKSHKYEIFNLLQIPISLKDGANLDGKSDHKQLAIFHL